MQYIRKPTERVIELDLTGCSLHAEHLPNILNSLLETVFSSLTPPPPRDDKTPPFLLRMILKNNSMGPDGAALLVQFLSDIVKMRPVEHLVLDLTGNRLCDAGCEQLANIPTGLVVHSLILGLNGITDAGVSALLSSDLLSRCSVESLSLRNNAIGPEGCRVIAARQGRSLCELDFTGNPCGNEGFLSVLRAQERGGGNGVKKLNFWGTRIDDDGLIAALDFLQQNHSLHELDLSNNPLTDLSIRPFFSRVLERNSSLLKVGFTGCKLQSKSLAMDIRERLKQNAEIQQQQSQQQSEAGKEVSDSEETLVHTNQSPQARDQMMIQLEHRLREVEAKSRQLDQKLDQVEQLRTRMMQRLHGDHSCERIFDFTLDDDITLHVRFRW